MQQQQSLVSEILAMWYVAVWTVASTEKYQVPRYITQTEAGKATFCFLVTLFHFLPRNCENKYQQKSFWATSNIDSLKLIFWQFHKKVFFCKRFFIARMDGNMNIVRTVKTIRFKCALYISFNTWSSPISSKKDLFQNNWMEHGLDDAAIWCRDAKLRETRTNLK